MHPHRNVRLLAWLNLCLDFRPYAPLAILYFSQVTGSYTLGLSIFSITTLSSCIFEVPTGIWSDRMGRRNTIVIGTIASTTAIILYAIGGSFWWLAAGACCEGFSRALFSGNNQAFLFDTLKEQGNEHMYGEFLGKTGAMFQLALGVSALIGGFVGTYSLLFVMWISVIPQIACIFISLLMREPQSHTNKIHGNIFEHLGEAIGKFRDNWRLRTLSLASIVDFGIGEVEFQFRPAFFGLFWPVWGVGIARGISNLMAGVSFWFAGPMMKKYKPLPTLIIGKVFNRSVSVLAVLFPTTLSPLLLSLTSIVYGFRNVAADTLFQKEFSDHQRATMGSLNSFAGSVCFGLFAIILGYFADCFGPTPALLLSELLLLPTIYWYYRLL